MSARYRRTQEDRRLLAELRVEHELREWLGTEATETLLHSLIESKWGQRRIASVELSYAIDDIKADIAEALTPLLDWLARLLDRKGNR